MKKLEITIRIILGIALLFFGLNGFFNWFTPPQGPAEEIEFLMALGKVGYIFPIVYITFIVSGLSFLTNKFIAIGLLILTPILLNIIFLHLKYSPEGIIPGGILFSLMVALFIIKSSTFMKLLKNE